MKFLKDVAALILMIISVVILASIGTWLTTPSAHAQTAPYVTQVIGGSNGNSNLQSVANMNNTFATGGSADSINHNDNALTATGGAGGMAQGGEASQSYNVDAIRQSPAVFMNAPAPTAPCQATAGGFVSFIAGGGFAASYTLEECEIRESARIAHGVGQYVMAKEILCMGKFARQTSKCSKVGYDPLR